MNSISGWFAIPLSLAVLGTVVIIMRCLRRKHVNICLKGLGVEIIINTRSKDGVYEEQSAGIVDRAEASDENENGKICWFGSLSHPC